MYAQPEKGLEERFLMYRVACEVGVLQPGMKMDVMIKPFSQDRSSSTPYFMMKGKSDSTIYSPMGKGNSSYSTKGYFGINPGKDYSTTAGKGYSAAKGGK